jgi:hypothetical protein
MNCGKDPHAQMTPGDSAVVDWFAAWLTWSRLPDDEKATVPEPVCPDGRAINEDLRRLGGRDA